MSALPCQSKGCSFPQPLTGRADNRNTFPKTQIHDQSPSDLVASARVTGENSPAEQLELNPPRGKLLLDPPESFLITDQQSCTGVLHNKIKRITTLRHPEINTIAESILIVRLNRGNSRNTGIRDLFERTVRCCTDFGRRFGGHTMSMSG
jgi:hypothetical protein